MRRKRRLIMANIYDFTLTADMDAVRACVEKLL
jgi:hypothetical protein